VRRVAIAVVVGSALAWSRVASADCSDGAHLATCFDADTFFPHPGPGTFSFIGGPATTAPGTFSLGLFAAYASRPVVLVAPTSDPKGSEVVGVDHLSDATLLFSLGLTSRLDAGVALPVVAYRTGLGISALTSNRSAEISHTALRDMRVGAGYRILGSPYDAPCPDPFGLAARFELSFPTGDETSFAGAGSLVAIPSVAGQVRRGPFVGAFEAGARLRKTVDLLGSRVGPQLSFALGLGADVLDEGKLGFTVEAVAMPMLVAQNELSLDVTTGNRVATGTRPPLVPAEWLASVRSSDILADGISLSLGAGTPLQFTGESGVTSPRYRVVFAVRYAP
jgi:hypothetical protein